MSKTLGVTNQKTVEGRKQSTMRPVNSLASAYFVELAINAVNPLDFS